MWYGRKHIWYKCACDCMGCAFCNGGLSSCTVCGGLEGSLTTTCPGVPVPEDQQDLVYKEGHDFIGGVWVGPEEAERLKEQLRIRLLTESIAILRTDDQPPHTH